MTERQLKRIINEEINNVLNEMVDGSNLVDSLIDVSSGIVKVILLELQDYLTDLLMKFKDAFIKEFKREASIYDMQEFMLMQLYKLTNSIENNLEDDDVVLSINSRYTSKGTTINAVIERDDIKYNFQTDVILAGGYNIQTLHNRYIVKTDLPKTNNSNDTLIYKDKLKKIQGSKKIQDEILELELKIENLSNERNAYEEFTDDEIIKDIIKNKGENGTYYPFMRWDELDSGVKSVIRRDWRDERVTSDYHFSPQYDFGEGPVRWSKEEIYSTFKDAEDFYDGYVLPNKTKTEINQWKRNKFIFGMRYTNDLEKEVEKLNKKLLKYN